MANLHGTCASGGREKESEKDFAWDCNKLFTCSDF